MFTWDFRWHLLCLQSSTDKLVYSSAKWIAPNVADKQLNYKCPPFCFGIEEVIPTALSGSVPGTYFMELTGNLEYLSLTIPIFEHRGKPCAIEILLSRVLPGCYSSCVLAPKSSKGILREDGAHTWLCLSRVDKNSQTNKKNESTGKSYKQDELCHAGQDYVGQCWENKIWYSFFHFAVFLFYFIETGSHVAKPTELSWQSACLSCMRLWVPSPLFYKPGMVVQHKLQVLCG